MLALFNSIMLKIVAGLGIVSFAAILCGVLSELLEHKGKFQENSFKIGIIGLVIMSFIAFTMVTVNLCFM